MITSEEYKNIYSAIIKMRPEIAPICKNKSANAVKYTYRYATLDSVIDLLTVVLPKYSLGWIQSIGTADGQRVLTTRIIHESGEWIEDSMVLPNAKPDGGRNENQELGASITYFKRYALSAMFGIATDDDTDGMADVRERKQQVRANARAAQAEGVMVAPEAEIAPDHVIHSPTPAKPAQAVEGGNVFSFPDVLKSTGDEATDKAITELVTRQYKGQPLFSPKTVAWLNGVIERGTAQEALAAANKAANQMINRIDGGKAA
jgi:hypothetical protein